MRHAFTVDVEDWYQGIPISDVAKVERRLDSSCNRLLDVMAEFEVRGTFFILGPVARDYPNLIRRITNEGHELGCHGWSHDLVYDLTPDQFRDETLRASDTISGLTGQAVTAYRAAYFSITRQSLWALDILAELGFQCDSSIFPVRNWRYGIPDYDLEPHIVNTSNGPICEVPMSVRQLGKRRLPVTGGAYFRLFPYWLSRSNLRAVDKQGRSVIFYLHPWELDPDHPRVDFYWKARLTHYANLRATEPRLRRLLAEFSFATLGEIVSQTWQSESNKTNLSSG
jgi:polysaccharide deacetylase family protein (PEP-CTERM system associated)